MGELQIQRAHWHDYSDQGCYMLTFTAEDRKACPFGIITGDSEDTATVVLTPLGQRLSQAIADIPFFYPEISVMDYVVMPDHCHVLVHVRQKMEKHLGRVVGMIKNVATSEYLHQKNMQDLALHLIPQSKKRDQQRQQQRIAEAIAAYNARGKEESTQPASGSYVSGLNEEVATIISLRLQCGLATPHDPLLPITLVPPLFSTGYHDRIVTRRGQISALRHYIRRNAPRLWVKQHADRSLMSVRRIKLPIPLPLAIELKQQAQYWDEHRGKTQSATTHRHDGKVYAATYIDLLAKFLLRDSASGSPYLNFHACGNLQLLNSARPLIRVRISRSVTREALAAELSRLLTLCEREGAILVSPFISWSEKEVLKAVRLNRYPHIILHGDSMSTYFKPSDTDRLHLTQYTPEWYNAAPLVPLNGAQLPSDLQCVTDGSLLILSPWHDRPKSEKVSKADCEVMNKVCEVMEKM